MKKKYRIVYSVEGVLTIVPMKMTVEAENEEKAKELAKQKIGFLSMYKNKKITIEACIESRPVTFN